MSWLLYMTISFNSGAGDRVNVGFLIRTVINIERMYYLYLWNYVYQLKYHPTTTVWEVKI